VVRIVTGKGAGSAGKPVLLPLVRQWLETDLARYVDAVTAEPGGGSYLVRMR
jgi:DNA-nicking Smr family endonuclease